ncbi:nickel/cobalt efflux transporter RcnA [Bradyrhizobium diazoefficiens]|jgi:nickel/cobalt transporter (NicO) family protein|nr:nickel/cobalt efflux transporter [Bradyrhizobium diazoefficiens]MBR0963817.1 nickel/cobalt efflux transporter RcnA [Bradyrhizobium diazoefficiens]MBR0977968.1 nickel/cobalt efflux transporter RcnA [Bradyrhizobium diazoefficiens]MBR1007478.1 nickel/cobalt efflux transporter RcnA [Bradyrhizobium diazoefficiens]MBR1012680.1 nickel/cobalt efflux transporter RcnA [Bradyrhizobium diazoefficiens]MBR1051565.1 nickel/cobalt efflux transporter RcnA [Bradyrhizobium diazoefficiens]
MPSFAELLQQGTAHAWLFIPSAILLGALHGLEPGHSKTLMAAFIVAIRGTVTQAVLLGVAATISHTIIVWIIALGGMYFWQGVDAESFEPYFQLASAAVIIAIALWMLRRTWQDQQRARAASGTHDHGHDHHHGHGEDIRHIDTGHGVIAVQVFEDGVPPRWRIRTEKGQAWSAKDVTVTTERPDGARQAFTFVDRGGYLESVDEIPEPHEFMARVSLGHGGHTHDYDLSFVEDHDHGHDHLHEELRGLDISSGEYQDAHELAHANDIRRRFADRNVTTGQIVMFGLTGGLIPCPASITVLLLCLQLKQFALGAVLVLSFSIGLAVTLVVVGAAAALSVHHASKRFSWFGTVARRAPYLSSALIILVGLYVAYQGWVGLIGHRA